MQDQKRKAVLSNELMLLDREIRIVRTSVVAAMIVVIALYFGWFGIVQRSSNSTESTNWGTLGDYFGGLLNPMIAFLALYWLTRSVRIQKEELNETRQALQESATSQRQQVRLAALTSLTSAVMNDLQFHQERLMFISNQLSSTTHSSIRDVTGSILEHDAALDFLKVIHEKILQRIAEQCNYEGQIVALLKTTEDT